VQFDDRLVPTIVTDAGRKHFTFADLAKVFGPGPVGNMQKGGGGFTLKDVKQIVEGRGEKDQYCSVTLADIDNGLFHVIRQGWNIELLPEHNSIADMWTTTLLLLGGKGTGTGLHMDWAEACNTAYAVGGASSSPGDEPWSKHILAQWVFFSPFVLDDLHVWLQTLGHLGGLADKPTLTMKQIRLARQRFGDKMVVMDQTPGAKVYVPPGWVHQVVNKKPGIKMACEVAHNEHFGVYALMHKVAARYCGPHRAEDYMGMNLVLEERCKMIQCKHS
jgi:hypothetical protein